MDTPSPALPEMLKVRQVFDIPDAVCVEERLGDQWTRIRDRIGDLNGARIAVCVGSRGISNLTAIVGGIVSRLRSEGASPFIVPAMGSHGGGTAEGQTRVLAHLGITRESMGVPVVADAGVVSLGEADGIPLFLSRPAFESDGMVLINRVKPHTDFTGPLESGIHKMLVIGLGNRKGADFYHKMAIQRGFYNMIFTAGQALLHKTPFLFGVAVVENQAHEICRLEMADKHQLFQTESGLLETARACLPGLPVDDVDLLIVDEMGKNFTGAGLDPNVVGFSSCRWGGKQTNVHVSRVFVRGLSPASEGNGSGIGMVDLATPRLVDAIDWETTAVNARTACCPEDCKVPLTLPTEKEAVAAALSTIRPHTMADLRIVHIPNTLELTTLHLSRGCLDALGKGVRIETESGPLGMDFDPAGNIVYHPTR